MPARPLLLLSTTRTETCRVVVDGDTEIAFRILSKIVYIGTTIGIYGPDVSIIMYRPGVEGATN